jgi:hemerythrin-like domain-containing protein
MRMSTFSDYMGDDHARCDQLFASVEELAGAGDWPQAELAHKQFIDAVERHFAMEEQVLFPAFEQASGSPMGPTGVMRHEHEQMRALFAEMEEALRDRDSDAYLGAAETLLILMQQHNAKEEQILYPMSDQLLQGERPALMERMQGQ